MNAGELTCSGFFPPTFHDTICTLFDNEKRSVRQGGSKVSSVNMRLAAKRMHLRVELRGYRVGLRFDEIVVLFGKEKGERKC